MDVDWCLSCERHLTADDHRHHQCSVLRVGPPSTFSHELDTLDDDQDDQVEIYHQIVDVAEARISRWASQIPPGASPDVPPLHQSRPPSLSMKPTQPSPPSVSLHTPEKVITSPVSQSPVSALPLRRVSKAPSTTTTTLFSALAGHVRSLVSRPTLPHSYSTSTSSTSENGDDLWWLTGNVQASSSKHKLSDYASSSSSSSASSPVRVQTHTKKPSSSSTSTRKPSKPTPLTASQPPSLSHSSSSISSISQTPFVRPKAKAIPIHQKLGRSRCDEPSYIQPRYLPIPPSHSSMKQRLVDDFDDLDFDARVRVNTAKVERVPEVEESVEDDDDDDALFFDDWKYTKGGRGFTAEYDIPSSPQQQQQQPSLNLVRGTRRWTRLPKKFPIQHAYYSPLRFASCNINLLFL
ncbi:hypothetical protein VKT23_010746 [Stygiomarasmius scandens]|uniref:Uncharacterized protein n=1 Tax=Marasmiellus scandens TaxID=2682957 RepID=A0ABR1JC32_9AGAR